MKLVYSWLKDFVDCQLNPQELAARLTMAGLEVEGITTFSDDVVFEISLTPNRGDCLSVLGLAREIAALTDTRLLPFEIKPVASTLTATLPIHITASEACPRYVGRIIHGVDNTRTTPEWMVQRLTAAGLNAISPIVDITNYVLLELGQPLHAFDLNQIDQQIDVRYAKANEKVDLLGDQTVELQTNTLVIADAKKVLAIAGIKGGSESAVNISTTEILLESAFFTPTAIAGQARRYGLNTDSAYRFERGVDPELTIKAIERATALLLEIVGGEAGPIIKQEIPTALPVPKQIHLRHQRIQRLLGINLDIAEVTAILQRLQLIENTSTDGWQVIPPSYRFDLKIEADLIEEIARLHGYDNIPRASASGKPAILPSEHQLSLNRIRQLLVDRDYHETITYSFVATNLQRLIDPQVEPLALVNPISSELAVMRSTLWPGLLTALQYNLNRQQNRVRLFETGLRFIPQAEELQQQAVLSGIVAGNAVAEQWGVSNKSVDFFDVKNDLENILALTQQPYQFTVASHPALHPGQTAAIYINNQPVGLLGKLNPAVAQTLGLTIPIYLFEIQMAALSTCHIPQFTVLSKFPRIRRDLALLLKQTITAEQLLNCIRKAAGELLVDLQLFDVYQGKNIPVGQKSVAVSLILQALDRTLLDEEVNAIVAQTMITLQNELQVSLRE